MHPLSPALRKAAVLVSALDDAAADALLDQMGPQEAAKVRSALVALRDVPAAEQEAVLAEFLKQQDASAASAHAADVALDLDPALELPASNVPRDATAVARTIETPLEFLGEVPPQALARLLRTEQPQAVAVVAASMSPESPAPEVLADLARWLRQQLAPHLGAAASRPQLAHQHAIRSALEARRQQQGLPASSSKIADSIVTAHRYRLESPAPAESVTLVEFEDLAQFDDESLRQVFAAADPQLTLVALTGADERLVVRILRTLPARDAAVLRQRLEHPGPIRLREIEQARQSLAAVAGRLARAGEIALPPSVRFAAAA
jgi:flagellar motor switch protein FliG